ncbi:MAG: hypothetical protein HY331_18000 [Chloroflexi bacterium]|nr:hypothetical protein [Chloroflexota bacterium]
MKVVRTEQGGTVRRSGRKGPGKTVKVTVTVPAALVDATVARVEADQAPSRSAYVSQALEAQIAADEGRDAFLEFLDRLDEELGAPTEEEYAWARRFAGQ